jgi:hypothetical protein
MKYTKSGRLTFFNNTALISQTYDIAKHGSYFYKASIENNSYSIYVLILNQTLDVVDLVHVGEIELLDGHIKPYIEISPKGVVHITAGYGRIYYWKANISDMQFKGGAFLTRGNYAYPRIFLVDEKAYMFCRGYDGMKIVSLDTKSIRNTIWIASSSPSICYYCGIFFQNGKLYVAGVGSRNGLVPEQRFNCYFAYTPDLTNWYAMNGSRITSPELIYDGYTSRYSITIDDNNKPLMFINYYNQDIESNYHIVYWENNRWNQRTVPIPNGIYGTFQTGHYYAWKADGVIHIFTTVQLTLYGSRIGEESKILHYWSFYPYTAWRMKNMTDAFDASSSLSVYLFEREFLVRFSENYADFITRVTRLPVGAITRYGVKEGGSNREAVCDYNNDKKIDILDIVIKQSI